VRAAAQFHKEGFGTPILIGNEVRVRAAFDRLGLVLEDGIEVRNARLSAAEDPNNARYVDFLYGRLQRKGYLLRDVQRMVNQDRNVFAAVAVALGDADGMVTGLSRASSQALEAVRLAIDPKPGGVPFGLSMVVTQRTTLLVADTLVHSEPSAEQLAAIAIGTALRMRALGQTPRVAFCSHSTFGLPPNQDASRITEAVRLLEARNVDFEFDGDLSPDVALDPGLRERYPFCRLTGNANVLVMPSLDAAQITTQMVSRLGEARVIGPVLTGLERPVQIVPMDSKVSDLVVFACLAATSME
jgi:malate dehydrogenase (oxaloacetate-decarboxylating)(NADP+)